MPGGRLFLSPTVTVEEDSGDERQTHRHRASSFNRTTPRSSGLAPPSPPRQRSSSFTSAGDSRPRTSSTDSRRARDVGWDLSPNSDHRRMHQVRVEKIARRLKGEMTLFRAMAIVDKLEAEEAQLRYIRSHRPHRSERKQHSVGFAEEISTSPSAGSFMESLSIEAQIAVLMEYKELIQHMLDDRRLVLPNQRQVQDFLHDDDWGQAGDPSRVYKLAKQYDRVVEILDDIKGQLGEEITSSRDKTLHDRS